MNKQGQMELDDFFSAATEQPPYLPTPYTKRTTGEVGFACWHPHECQQRRHADSLACIYHVAEAHGCTLTAVCITALKREIRAYKHKLKLLEAEAADERQNQQE